MTAPPEKWRSVLWREWRNCKDLDFAEHLLLMLLGNRLKKVRSIKDGLDKLRFFLASFGIIAFILSSIFIFASFFIGKVYSFYILRFWLFMLLLWTFTYLHKHIFYIWWRHRPLASEVIEALQEAVKEQKNTPIRQMVDALRADIHAMKEAESADIVVESLRSGDTLQQIAAYYALVSKGGKAVIPLQEVAEQYWFKPWITQTIKRIASDTFARLTSKASLLFCPHCLTRYSRHKVHLGGLSWANFWGCRACQDSNGYLECEEVVALLDSAAGPAPIREGDSLLVNWTPNRALFDFDRVLIRNASDAEIERFAVQVGNDTDPSRRERYREMICTVECSITPNTRRILDSLFWRVQQELDPKRIFPNTTEEDGQIWMNRGL